MNAIFKAIRLFPLSALKFDLEDIKIVIRSDYSREETKKEIGVCKHGVVKVDDVGRILPIVTIFFGEIINVEMQHIFDSVYLRPMFIIIIIVDRSGLLLYRLNVACIILLGEVTLYLERYCLIPQNLFV